MEIGSNINEQIRQGMGQQEIVRCATKRRKELVPLRPSHVGQQISVPKSSTFSVNLEFHGAIFQLLRHMQIA